jgi:hypothetical protein
VEHIIFHHGGNEYIVYDALTENEIRTITAMEEERNRKLDALNKKSMKKYFDDTDKMVMAILRKCFHLTDKQISDLDQIERRSLAHAFIRFIAAANNIAGPNN